MTLYSSEVALTVAASLSSIPDELRRRRHGCRRRDDAQSTQSAVQVRAAKNPIRVTDHSVRVVFVASNRNGSQNAR